MLAIREALFKLEKFGSGTLLVVLTGTIFIQVISRFLLNLPLAWSEEVSRYSFIWLTMLTTPVCVRLNANIGMDMIVRRLPANLGTILELLSSAIALLLAIVWLIYGTTILFVVQSQSSPAIGIPMYWVYAALPVGAALMIAELMAAIGIRFGWLNPKAA
jgi:TRAP-type C4-dicarboxylate transport system permease small subunit